MESMKGARTLIPEKLYFRIGDVADIVGVKPYVLRYWESEFPLVSPDKSDKGQRVYRRHDVENLLLIKHLLYKERYSIEGARKRINELRKEGDLKGYKDSKVLPEEQAASGAEERRARFERARALVDELQGLAMQPLGELFRY